MRAVAGLGLTLGLLVAALAGCGGEDDPTSARASSTAAGGIELSIRYRDGDGKTELGLLTCRAHLQRAGGFLRDATAVGELCASVRATEELLTTPPARDRACTQLYGGPETAHVTGTIDGRRVDRRFARTDGCEIDDFSRAAYLLQP